MRLYVGIYNMYKKRKVDNVPSVRVIELSLSDSPSAGPRYRETSKIHCILFELTAKVHYTYIINHLYLHNLHLYY